MSYISADPILKDHLKKKEVFADLINGILFDGKQVLSPDNIEDYDSDMASLFSHSQPFSINRNRDIITKSSINGIYMLIAIENQSTVDPLMPLRILTYDTLSYHQQYRRYKSSKRDNPTLTLELLPVHTLVIYYRENIWSGPKTLLDMMNIPDNIKKRLNNWFMDIVDVKELSYHKFKDKENYDFFKYLQKLYNWDGNQDSLKEFIVSKNVATLIAAVAGNNKMLEIIQHTKGDEINMCQSIDLFEQRAINHGKEIGEQIGTELGQEIGKLSLLKNLLQSKLGTLSTKTLNNIDNCSSEKIDLLAIKIFDITSEDEINNILNN